MVSVPAPPVPFDPLVSVRPAGTVLYRVHRAKHRGDELNPGIGPTGRFSFFGAPPVPAWYGGTTEGVAVCETLLHGRPLTGAVLPPEAYVNHVLTTVTTTRALSLVRFHGPGLRRLGVEPTQLTDTDANQYDATVKWAEAAHSIRELEGVEWMSRQWNSDQAVMLFGDRIEEGALHVDAARARRFNTSEDQDWLIELGTTMKVAVSPRMRLHR